MKKLALLSCLSLGLLSGCGGGISPVSMPTSAGVSAALTKWETTAATYNFASPALTATATSPAVASVPAVLTVGTGGAISLSVNGTSVLSGTAKFSASGDYLGFTTTNGAATDTATTQTALSTITSVGQSGNLYTGNLVSAGVSIGTTAVTYALTGVAPNLADFCANFTFTALSGVSGLTSSSGQVCWNIDTSTNTVTTVFMELNTTNGALPFLQQ